MGSFATSQRVNQPNQGKKIDIVGMKTAGNGIPNISRRKCPTYITHTKTIKASVRIEPQEKDDDMGRPS